LLAFSGNRTHHRLFSGVEDAGFEIRDTVTWHYGSGFPKALDVSKAIDKQAGTQRKDMAETLRNAREDADLSRTDLAGRVGCTPSSIRDWEEGRARSEGQPVEWVVPSPEYRSELADVLPAYPTEAEREVVGTYQEGDRDGVFDEESSGFGSGERTTSSTDAAETWDGWKTALKPATEFVVVARAPLSEGTVAENVQTHGTGALNIDGCRIGNWEHTTIIEDKREGLVGGNYNEPAGRETVEGRYPANVVFDETAADELDEVSRYFYTSKATRAERTLDGLVDNAHPTVKPTDLMEWLVRLVTAEDQVVLDPFAGSGTTGIACKRLGREFVGIEQNPEYADLARARIGLDVADPTHVRGDDDQSGLEAFADADE